MPRFWLLVARTVLGKRAHRRRDGVDYRSFLSHFYTRDRTADVEFYGDAYRDVRPFLVELAEIGESDRVLDVATGGGYQAAAFSGTGRMVVGVDYVHDRVRLASERHGSLDVGWSAADATALPFADDAFDVVTGSLALHDMPVDVQMAALREMRRVAGRCVVVLEPRPPHRPVWKHVYTVVGELIDESIHFREFAMCDFESNLAAAGLIVTRRQRCYHGVLVAYVCRPGAAA